MTDHDSAGARRGDVATITIVGLGPGADDHVTADTLSVIERIERRHLRTAVHPSAHLVLDAPGGAVTHDDLYESADTFADVYAEIAERLIADAVEHGDVLYAVPGSPLVLERTVRMLRERSAETDAAFTLDVRPAMSFLDVAWARLAIDPVEAGVRLVDGHEFATAAADQTGPMLVAHTHANWVLSDIKLAADGTTGDEAVIILQSLGTDDERVVDTTWAELDRTIDADHLTSIYIAHLATPVGHHYTRFHQLARTLREQCPWDVEQTHQSLIPYLLEETYEVVDALQSLPDPERVADPGHGNDDDGHHHADHGDDHDHGHDPDADLIEELGDLLYQIEFHATIAEQEGRFTIADVAEGIHDKLVRRHPHIFADTVAEDTGTVVANWDDIKQVEKGRTSIFDGIPRSMPALSTAAKVGRKASKVGFDWPDVSGAMSKIVEEAGEVVEAIEAGDIVEIDAELGDLLFAVVNVARHVGIDPELALRRAADKFRKRFEGVETLAKARSIDLKQAQLATLDELWDEVKHSER